MAGDTRAAVLENAARRIRALTGFDRVTVFLFGDGAERRAESARSKFASPASSLSLPAIVADTMTVPVGVFPAAKGESTVGRALLRGLSGQERDELQAIGVRSVLSVPLARQGREIGTRTLREPDGANSVAGAACRDGAVRAIVAIELERAAD